MPKNQSNGYRVVYMPNHKRAYKNGTVYEHVLIAEQIIGRSLKPGEVVHHKDRNRLNNLPDNLIVFASNSAHTLFHANNCNQESLVLLPDKTCTCLDLRYLHARRYDKFHDECPSCHGPKHITAGVCDNCRRMHFARNIPDKDSLSPRLNEHRGNFTKVAAIYGVTDNAVRKWCKKYGLPSKTREYRNNPVA